MICRQFLPPEPTNHPHPQISEPANEHAGARPVLSIHALNRYQTADGQYQRLIASSDPVQRFSGANNMVSSSSGEAAIIQISQWSCEIR